MPARYREKVRAIVKTKLNTGLIQDYDDFQKLHYAEAEDIIEIIDEVEQLYKVEFDDSEHFRCTNIENICKILSQKDIDDTMMLSFGGPCHSIT